MAESGIVVPHYPFVFYSHRLLELLGIWPPRIKTIFPSHFVFKYSHLSKWPERYQQKSCVRLMINILKRRGWASLLPSSFSCYLKSNMVARA